MNHQLIEEHQVVDRYLMGRLTADEMTRFEEHYLHCSQCLERLEVGEKMLRGLKRAVAQDVVETVVAGRVGLLARLARSRRAGWMTALAVAVAVGIPAYLIHRQSVRLSEDLDKVRLALRNQQDREATTGSSTASLEQQLAEKEIELAAQRQQFDEQLAAQQEARQGLIDRLTRAFEPQLNFTVASLSPLRNSGPGAQTPTYVIRLSDEPEWVPFSLLLDEPRFETYRVSLIQDRDQEVGRFNGLTPDDRDALGLGLHSTRLEAGDYLARVFATPAVGEPEQVADFAFRVIRD